MDPETTLFYLFGAVAVVTSLLVIAQRNPIYSVLLLIASFGALSGLYVLLDAPFVAVIQITVYTGTMMGLFLFAVLLLNAPREDADDAEHAHPLRQPSPVPLGAALAVALSVELVWALTKGRGEAGPFPGGEVSPVRAIGRSLLIDYGFAFGVTSVLILVAMIGAVLLVRRDPGAPGGLEPLRGARAPTYSAEGVAPAHLNDGSASARPNA